MSARGARRCANVHECPRRSAKVREKSANAPKKQIQTHLYKRRRKHRRAVVAVVAVAAVAAVVVAVVAAVAVVTAAARAGA